MAKTENNSKGLMIKNMKLSQSQLIKGHVSQISVSVSHWDLGIFVSAA